MEGWIEKFRQSAPRLVLQGAIRRNKNKLVLGVLEKNNIFYSAPAFISSKKKAVHFSQGIWDKSELNGMSITYTWSGTL
jgi:hypothetical protein